MTELCAIVSTTALAGVAVALMVLVWKFRPVPDNQAIEMAAEGRQAAWENGVQWERQRVADGMANRGGMPTGWTPRVPTGSGEPAIPVEEEKPFPGEESVEMSLKC